MNSANEIRTAANELQIEFLNTDASGMFEELAARINAMLLDEFDKLISILYRMDVNEKKLRQIIQENPNENAGDLIASLMIERHQEKIKSRQQYSQRDNDITEEEQW